MRRLFYTIICILIGLISCKKEDEKTTIAKKETSSASSFQPSNIKEQMIYQRGIEAAIWGIPVVNYQLMFDAMSQINGKYNQILIWPKLLDWTNQTLTPNPDVIYLMPFFDTKNDGPIVIEIPPADNGVFNGSIMNKWQAAIEDIGPGGIDKGKGGKYLFLPPNYDKNKIPSGYIPIQSDTYTGYALIRSVLKSGSKTDVDAAIAYGKRIKLYPLSQAGNNPQTTFVDASKGVFNSKITYDINFYKALNETIQNESWLERDRAMIDPLKTIGMEAGKPFNPDERTKEILELAVKKAKEWLEFNYDQTPTFFKDTNWFFPASKETKESVTSGFKIPDIYPTDNRAICYMIAFFSAKHLGESQFYLMNLKDKEGNFLNGNQSYKVTVPANVPVKQYWSMTVYNRATHTFIENAKWVGRSSQTPGLKKNPDGSVTLYFGPKPPPEGESNWIPTDPEGEFEILARFYGPTKALYDQSWKLTDIEKY